MRYVRLSFLTRALPASVLIVGGLLAACSSSGSSGAGAGAVTGSVGGTTFSPVSVVAFVGAADSSSSCDESPDGGSVCTNSSSGQALTIIMSNRAGETCSNIFGDINVAGGYASYELLGVGVGTDTGTLKPGTYNFTGKTGNVTSGAFGEFVTTTATCGKGLELQSSGGSLTLTAISADSAQGTYDVSFGSEGSFSGSFNVTMCPFPDGGLQPTLPGDASTALKGCTLQ